MKRQFSLMHIFSLTLTFCIHSADCFAFAQAWSDFDLYEDVLGGSSNLFTSEPPYENDLWGLSSIPSNSDDSLLLVDSNSCDSSLSPLGRRAGETCTNETPPVDKPSIEVRPLGTTKDAPLLPTKSNYYLCLPDLLGYSRNFAMCDSGEESRLPTDMPGVFDLSNADICTRWPYYIDLKCADSSAVDILQGCFNPRQAWCCGKIGFQTPQDQRVCDSSNYV